MINRRARSIPESILFTPETNTQDNTNKQDSTAPLMDKREICVLKNNKMNKELNGYNEVLL